MKDKNMTRIKLILFLFAFHFSLLSALAQQADLKQAVARYQKATCVTAQTLKTTHKNAVAKDQTTRGTLTMRQPSEVVISMEGGKDQLKMQGNVFTMVVRGKSHTTNSQTNAQFRSFQTVFEYILQGGKGDLSKLEDFSIQRQGGTLVLTITPKAANKKAQHRMLFSSFVLTIDAKTSELKSLRMNERSGYTEYTFSDYQFK